MSLLIEDTRSDIDALHFPIDLEGRFMLLTAEAVSSVWARRDEIRDWLKHTLISMDIPYAQAKTSSSFDVVSTTILWEICTRFGLPYVLWDWSYVEKETKATEERQSGVDHDVMSSLFVLERESFLCILSRRLCDGVNCEYERSGQRASSMSGEIRNQDEIPLRLRQLAERSVSADKAVLFRAFLSALYLRDVAFIVDGAPSDVCKEGDGPPGDWIVRSINLFSWTKRTVISCCL